MATAPASITPCEAHLRKQTADQLLIILFLEAKPNG
jgi:hypothetical protein